MASPAEIYVIIVTYNGIRWVDACLGSLRDSTVALRTVVVDNGSTDGTPQRIAEAFPEVHLICAGENLGFGRGNNAGIRYAMQQGATHFFLLNQDAWIYPDTVARLLAAEDECTGILSPVHLDGSAQRMDEGFKRYVFGSGAAKKIPSDSQTQQPDAVSCLGTQQTEMAEERNNPQQQRNTAIGSDGEALQSKITDENGLPTQQPGRTIPNDNPIGQAKTEIPRIAIIPDEARILAGVTTPREVDFVNAAAWLLPLHTIEAVGGFDPFFYHYGEDNNYCQRVLNQSLTIRVVPRAFICHDRQSTKRPLRNAWFGRYLLIAYCDPRLSAWQATRRTLLRQLGVLARAPYYLLRGDRKSATAILDAYRTLLRRRKEIIRSKQANTVRGAHWL